MTKVRLVGHRADCCDPAWLARKLAEGLLYETPTGWRVRR